MKFMTKLFFLLALIPAACSFSPKVDLVEEQQKLLATDSSFSALSEQKGMTTAFLYYADKNVIELNDGAYPSQGIEGLARRYKDIDNSKFVLSWKALKCEIAQSGDLAYTFGDWRMDRMLTNGADTTLHGNYITVWKKQKDGNWKFVLDGGNSTPGPTTLVR